MNTTCRITLGAVILALGLVASAALLSKFFVRIRHEQSIAVKGYAEKSVVSDVGKFSCCCNARGKSLAEAYAKLQAGKSRVEEYLHKAGFVDADVEAGTIGTTKVCKRDEQGRETNEIEYYDVSQTFNITSTNAIRVKEVATSITELIKEGVDISASQPEFYVSDLQDTKVQLLSKATEDAYRRAVTLAEGSHGKVGALTSAQQGVFQITARHSTDTSGNGMYDTATIEKTAKAVVTLEYAIDKGN